MVKKETILVTGASGFIGKNLIFRLAEQSKYDVIKFCRADKLEGLEKKIKKSDIIVHLASEIRPKNKVSFEQNLGLTKKICETITRIKKEVQIIFMSSIRSSPNASPQTYDFSKFEVEDFLVQFSKNTGNPVTIFKPPGVFGKWSRPNFNSVVATFCFNIANNLPIEIHDEKKSIKLLYVDDLISQIIEAIEKPTKEIWHPKFEPIYEISLKNLAESISSFEEGRKNLFVENVGVDFFRKLYATYLSYLPKEKFSYEIPQYKDNRGIFSEIIKTQSAGQFSFFTCNPGVTRGQHYHNTKNEKFLVISGEARFRFRHIITGEIYEIETNRSVPRVVDTVPGWAHNITNIGSEDLIVIIWANEVFDRNNPDTIACEV